NLTAYLALSVRVLLVDLDPQENATSSFGLDPHGVELSTYDALIGDADLDEVIVTNVRDNLDLAPGSRALAGAQVELVEMTAREQRLRRAIEQARDRYSLIVVDCKTSLGILTLNELVAAV